MLCGDLSSKSCVNSPCIIWMKSPHHCKMVDILPVLVFCGAKLHGHWPRLVWISRKYLNKMNSILTIFCILLLLAPASKMMHWEFGCNGRKTFSNRTLHFRLFVAFDGDDGDDEYFGKVNEINHWTQSLYVRIIIIIAVLFLLVVLVVILLNLMIALNCCIGKGLSAKFSHPSLSFSSTKASCLVQLLPLRRSLKPLSWQNTLKYFLPTWILTMVTW